VQARTSNRPPARDLYWLREVLGAYPGSWFCCSSRTAPSGREAWANALAEADAELGLPSQFRAPGICPRRRAVPSPRGHELAVALGRDRRGRPRDRLGGGRRGERELDGRAHPLTGAVPVTAASRARPRSVSSYMTILPCRRCRRRREALPID
jgi:hypothetical protein